MERELDVRTGEAIAVRYELAGVGTRFLALSIDFAIQIGIVIAILIAASLVELLFHSVSTFARFAPLDRGADIAVRAALSIAVFVLFFGYFIIFELAWNGQSPGKRLLGIRVVRDAGFPIDAGASVIRNLVRLVEVALGFYLISAVATLLSKENKRLGDIAAGTIVIRDRFDEAPELDALVRTEDRDDGLDREDRVLIERFLARRESLDRNVRLEIAEKLAERVRPKLRASFHYLDDELLLEHLGRP